LGAKTAQKRKKRAKKNSEQTFFALKKIFCAIN
jgi:hypothetical protein